MAGALVGTAAVLALSAAAAAAGVVPQKAAAHQRLAVVETIGCLTPAAKDAWVVAKATPPKPASAPTPVSAADATPLGDKTFRLIGIALFNPSKHAGQKVRVQGLQVKDAINVTSLAMVREVCAR